MNALLLLCMFPFTGDYAMTRYYMPATLIERHEHTFVVDFSAAADRLRIDDRDYSRYEIASDKCYFKSDTNDVKMPDKYSSLLASGKK